MHTTKLLLTLAICLAFTSTTGVHEIATANTCATVTDCNCGQPGCLSCLLAKRKCRKQRCVRCPKCQVDVCQLHAACVMEQRLCFDTEQKVICIPKITLPWQKSECCCDGECLCRCKNRCGKSKVVNVLKAKVVTCPACRYTWKLCEPELPKSPAETGEAGPDELPNPITQPEYERDALYDPDGSDVTPAPPVRTDPDN